MKFHHVHGSAISLSEDSSHAQRSSQHFCNGIVFSDQPIVIGQKLCLELTCISSWSGALRIGITTHDPESLTAKDLPPYLFPDLTDTSGYFGRAISESFTSTGTKLTFYVNASGQLQLFVNGEHKGAYLYCLPTLVPLWVVLDLYGNTEAVKFIPPDEAPTEIVARGPDAVLAYEAACSSGTQPVYRTRLMLVGQDRVGKTSLKRALMGQSHNEQEESTDGIDLSSSCSFNLSSRSAWKLAVQDKATTEDQSVEDRKDMGILGGPDGLLEEYHRAIASNIVQELQYKKMQKENMQSMDKSQENMQSTDKSKENMQSTDKRLENMQSTDKSQENMQSTDKSQENMQSTDKSKDLLSSMNKRFSNKVAPLETRNSSSTPPPEVINVPPERLKEVPDRVVELVQEMQSSPMKRPSTADTPTPKNIVLNIWDFAGQAVYYTTHQVFLSSRAVYVIVFNLCHDLSGLATNFSQTESTPEILPEEDSLSNLDYLDFWMRSIHAHAAQNTRNSVDNMTLSPPIFIVGTHRNSLSSDLSEQSIMVEEKFNKIRVFLSGKPYFQHIVTPFFAVENSLDGGDLEIDELRKSVECVSSKEPYMGESMPIKWLQFERDVTKLIENDTYFITLDQAYDLAADHLIDSETEVKTMLEFYHDLGLIIYYGGSGAMDNVLRNTVILKPQWLVDMFKRILTSKELNDKWVLLSAQWQKLEDFGVLEEDLIDFLWQDVIAQKGVLLGLMEKFDLLCESRPVSTQQIDHMARSFYVPARLKPCVEKKRLYVRSKSDRVIYLDFHGFLPEGLFHRILTRAIIWSQDCGGRDPCMSYKITRFFLDAEHDFVLEMSARKHTRIRVIIMRIVDLNATDDSENRNDDDAPPSPAACAKVRNFLESTLSELRELWMKRIVYDSVIECPCLRECSAHDKPSCPHEDCLHFLNLDECITNRVVCCEHRRVKTEEIMKWFPKPNKEGLHAPVIPDLSLYEMNGNIEKNVPDLPSWVRGAAKLLNGGAEKQDWLALAQNLGYKDNKIEQFNDDFNPGLALLADWIVSSGNTSLSVDVLITYLEQMDRNDIIDVIQQAKGFEDPSQVFISYQWDSQDEIQILRDRLERRGISCWMDIGQMGGGDQLYTKIDGGIRNCKVVIACVTPKYIVSHHCNRELSLSDLLRKPIIPIMYEKVPWPPPGGMALMFSQLVYINMKGVGGHGGTGIHADLEDKYSEIIQRVSRFATPDPSKCSETTTLTDGSVNRHVLSDHSLSDSHSSSYLGGELPPMQNIIMSRILPSHHPAESRSNTTHSAGAVEQVHVAKCAVCAIL